MRDESPRYLRVTGSLAFITDGNGRIISKFPASVSQQEACAELDAEEIIRLFWEANASPCSAWYEGKMIMVSPEGLLKFAAKLMAGRFLVRPL